MGTKSNCSKNFLNLDNIYHGIYVDFSFLGRANETSTNKIQEVVQFKSKFDFLIDSKGHKEFRLKLLKMFGPLVFGKYRNKKSIILTFNLIGETKSEVIELASANL